MTTGAGELPDDLSAADPGGMLGMVLDAPAQWRQAIQAADELPPAAVPPEPRNVVVAGMGGSGIAGDIAAALAHDRGRAPVVPVKGYRLPVWVGSGSLVIAVSHSGNTEEILAAAEQAADTGADLLVVTSGGRLQALGDRVGCPVVTVPGELPPRASIAYLTTPVVVALERAGVLPGVGRDLAELPGHLAGVRDRWRPGAGSADEADEGPEGLAARLVEATPLFLGQTGLESVVAYRASCQLNENAERIALHGELPEADHNAVVAWAAGGSRHDRLVLVELRDADEPAQVAGRFAATREVAAGRFEAVVSRRLAGPNPLARLAAGILYVDLVSVVLALMTGVDPTPVEPITRLKQRLGGAVEAATPTLHHSD